MPQRGGFLKSCCFIGHKDCPNNIRDKLRDDIRRLINKGVETFYVGTQGNFDKVVYEVLRELEREYEIKTIVVLAYLDRKSQNIYFDMDKTVFPDELTKVPLRFAIRRRNSYMIERSDYVVTYLNTPYSNTIANVEEAIRKKKVVINLGDYSIE